MDSTNQLFEKTPVLQAITRLIIPTICSNLVMIIYSLADTFFVGFLNSAVQSAAVSLCAPLLLSFNAVNNLFGVGSSSLLSRALGKKDNTMARQAASFGIWGALAAGCFFSLAAFLFLEPLCLLLGTTSEAFEATSRYMIWAVVIGAPFSILNVVFAFLVRAEGKSLQASIGTMSGAFLNILLDPLFIFSFGMGAEGAALATCLSNMFAVGYFLVYLKLQKKNTVIRLSPKWLYFSKVLVSSILVVGIPASIQNLLNVFSQMLMNNIASGYGTDAIAAVGIAFRIANVLIYVAIGISQGVMPLIGFTYAAGLFERMKKTIRTTIMISMSATGSLAILFCLFSNPLISFFIPDEGIIETGGVLLKGMSLAVPLIALDFIGVGVFQACGKGMVSLYLAIFRKLICEIPLLLLLSSLFGLFGLSISQLIAEILCASLSMGWMMSFLKKHAISSKKAVS